MSASQKELRKAFAVGFREGQASGSRGWASDAALTAHIKTQARLMYPPKMVERPREVIFADGSKGRIRDGCLEWEYAHRTGTVRLTDDATMTALWADLLANPTEMVEVDE